MPTPDDTPSRRSNPTLARLAAAEAAWLAGKGGGGPASRKAVEDREQRIRELAYLRAERRGFAPGSELDDWLAAEQEADSIVPTVRRV